MEHARISPGALFSLTTMLYALVVIFPFSQLAETSQQDAWMGMALGVIAALALVMFAAAVGPRGEVSFMPAWIEAVLGVWLGRVVNVSIVLYFLFKVGLSLRQVQEVISLFVLPETPSAVIAGLVAFPAALAARLGVEVMARTAQFYLIIIIGAIALMVASLGHAVEFAKFLPVFSAGFRPIALSAVVPSAFLGSFIFGLWLLPYVDNRRVGVKAIVGALGLGGAFALTLIVLAEGIFGYREIQRMLIPAAVLVRSIRLGEVVERLDVALIAAWALAAFLKTSFYVYLSSVQLAWVAGTNVFRPFAVPIAALGIGLSLGMAENVLRFSDFINVGAYAPYTYVHIVGVPLLLLGGLACRRLFGRPIPGSDEERATSRSSPRAGRGRRR